MSCSSAATNVAAGMRGAAQAARMQGQSTVPVGLIDGWASQIEAQCATTAYAPPYVPYTFPVAPPFSWHPVYSFVPFGRFGGRHFRR